MFLLSINEVFSKEREMFKPYIAYERLTCLIGHQLAAV